MVTDDESTGKRWKPNNYEETFQGEVPVRKALIHSLNTPAIRTLQQVGVKAAGAWAHKLGITTKINEDLSMALGSSCVYLWDLTQVFTLFNRMGRGPGPSSPGACSTATGASSRTTARSTIRGPRCPTASPRDTRSCSSRSSR